MVWDNKKSWGYILEAFGWQTVFPNNTEDYLSLVFIHHRRKGKHSLNSIRAFLQSIWFERNARNFTEKKTRSATYPHIYYVQIESNTL